MARDFQLEWDGFNGWGLAEKMDTAAIHIPAAATTTPTPIIPNIGK